LRHLYFARNVQSSMLDMLWPCRVLESLAGPYLVGLNSLPTLATVSSLTVAVPTRSLLRAYVSSHKTDVFTCNSDRTDSFLTPPYACAYTHGALFFKGERVGRPLITVKAAKRGGVPRLAVATEQGTVYVWDTSKREELGRGQSRPQFFTSPRTRLFTVRLRYDRAKSGRS
jgi:hypothetical protein